LEEFFGFQRVFICKENNICFITNVV